MTAESERRGLLDPSDWDSFAEHAHALLDRMIARLRHAGDGPVWRPVPDDVKRRLAQPAPAQPEAIDHLLADLSDLVLPYAVGNTHPRFWGWVHGSGTPGGVLAEMVAATLNENCGGRDHGGIYLERAVVDWARQWFEFPVGAAGLLVSGSSMANLLGLTVARQNGGGADIRSRGLAGAPLVAYASAQAHSSLGKAMELLGLGREAMRPVPVGTDLAMDVAELQDAIAADRAAGRIPFCIAATAGSVGTGAFDDLRAIAALCRKEGLWMHVDGAFGALVRLTPDLAHLAAGIDQADSIAFDFHKWLHVPYDAGCLLVRDGARLRATFGGRPDYLASIGGLSAGEPWPSDLGIELSRGLRALKVWWTVKEQGTERLGKAIARNCAQARRLATLLSEIPEIVVAAPVPLNIVCCRYTVPGRDGDALDALNAAIVVAIQESGVAVTSSCRIDGRLCLRICITNHRSRDDDFDLLARTIAATGTRLAAATPGV